jgi:PPP family 3-phenylpropionic acid transporter
VTAHGGLAASPAQKAIAADYARRVSAFYGAVFIVIGGYMPYLPVWLDWRGLSPAEISIVLAAPMFVRLVFTPVISFLADRFGNHRAVLLVLSAGVLFCGAVLINMATFWPILLMATLHAVFWTSIIPLGEVVALAGVRRLGLDYGRMRLWGSVTFIGGSFAGGLALDRWGPPSVVWVLLAAAGLIMATVLALPQTKPEEGTTRRSVRVGEAFELARSPLFLLFVLSASAVSASHAVFYGFGTLYLRELGYSSVWVGTLWAISVIAEIILFAYSGAVLRRFGPVNLIIIGAVAALIRWPLMSLDPSLGLMCLLQVLHGATFGATHLGAVTFISRAIPDRFGGTAQGLYSTLSSGVVMGAAMLSAGPLYAAYAGGAFLVMVVPAAMALAAGLLLRRLWREQRIVDG